MLTISPEAKAISDRFFEAFGVLTRQKKIKGLKTFGEIYGFNQGNLATLKNHTDRCILKPEYIAILTRDFNVNPEWILLGTGSMFKQVEIRKIAKNLDLTSIKDIVTDL